MSSQKTLQVIESVKNMTDKETEVLDIFITGFKAGMNISKNEIQRHQPRKPPENQTA